MDTDPDSYFIDDVTERSLLSYGSEVIIGDCKNGYTLYKMFDWGYISFPITNITETVTLLTSLNNLSNVIMSPFNINGAPIAAVQEVIANSTLAESVTTSGPEVGGSGGGPSSGSGGPTFSNDCHRFGKDKGENIFSSDRRIIWKHKVKEGHFPNTGQTKIKSITESFRKKNGKWKKFKTSISAGVNGSITDYYSCVSGGSLSESKQKNRRRLKEIHTRLPFGFKPNSFFSTHSQDGSIFNKDIY